jgi:hypothetical protein
MLTNLNLGRGESERSLAGVADGKQVQHPCARRYQEKLHFYNLVAEEAGSRSVG